MYMRKYRVHSCLASPALLAQLGELYEQIEEYGPKNKLSNLHYLTWKHLDNPNGRSHILYCRSSEGQIVGAIILQKKRYFNNSQEFRYLLACDLGIRKQFRNQNIFFLLWAEIYKKFAINNTIYHSSNKLSEPFYSQLKNHQHIFTLSPYFYIPFFTFPNFFAQNFELNKLNMITDRLYLKWRLRSVQNSNIKSLNDIMYTSVNFMFIKVIIILDYSLRSLTQKKMFELILREKNPFIIQYSNNSLRPNFFKFPRTNLFPIFPVYIVSVKNSKLSDKHLIPLDFLDLL